MKVFNFVKFVALSVVVSHTHLFADTYKLEIKKDKQTVKFYVHNLTRKCDDCFSVKKVGSSYENGDGSAGSCIWGTGIGIGIGFNFGGFRANFDDEKNQLNLCGGRFTDTLLLENCDYPTVGTGLQANTLIVKKTIFKNEGTLDAFVTVLERCPTVENKGTFHARNLFLYGTDIQNYGMVQWDDAFKAVGGKIIPKAANSDFPEKKGFFRQGVPTGNTRVLSLHKTYHGKTVVDKGRLQVNELTDGSLNVFSPFGGPWSYTAVLVGHLDVCNGISAGSGTTLNFYPGSCFVIKEGSGPVVLGPGMTLNLGWSDNPSWGDCSFKDNTINIKSGSVSPLNNQNGGSKDGIWLSPFNGKAPLFPDFDTVRTYQARETEELTLYIIGT